MSAHVDPPGDGRRLTREEVPAELLRVNFKPGGQVQTVGRHCAARIPGHEGAELDIDAVRRALTSRNCPADVAAHQFLNGIMRSIASSILRARERRRESEVAEPIVCASAGRSPTRSK